jgi:putative transposase
MYYHVWFVTKYRKTALEGERDTKAKEYFREVASNRNYCILEMETNKDHVHMLLEAKDSEDLASMVRALKAVSARKLLARTPHLRAGKVSHFWARTFGRKIVSVEQLENTREYIRNQKRIPHT